MEKTTFSNQIGSEESTPMILFQMMTASWISQAIYVAACIGIADLLKDSTKSIDELAKATNSHGPNLYRLLRALASVGIFIEVEPQQFALTPIAEHLRSDTSASLRAMAMMLGDQWHWRCWGDIVNIVINNQPAIQHLYKVNNTFEYFAQNPQSGDIFNNAMTNWCKNSHTAVVDTYDFSSIRKIVDVAGGHGTLITSILAANPQMHGILFDLNEVIDGANELLKKQGIADRCVTFAGDFFQSIPSGADAYILSHIMHDWKDDDCIKILRNIRKGIVKNGKLLVIEAIIPPGNQPHLSKLLDLEMLVMYPAGRERTITEYKQLYDAAGFRLTNVTTTNTSVSLIEGIPV